MEPLWYQGPFTFIAALPSHGTVDLPLVEQAPDTDLQELCARLLDLGGTAVVVPLPEASASSFWVAKGRLVPHTRIHSVEGEDRDCHTNSAKLWRQRGEHLRIGTGYGLSPDGMWRRHSWVMEGESEVIETTIPRDKYFGVILDDSQAEGFAFVYDPPDSTPTS